MFSLWFVLAIAAAIADWAALYWDKPKVNYFTKPAVMIFLILWTLQETGWQSGFLWFGLALLFCLAGDVILLLPDRLFVGGLAAFLLGHICYLIGFNQQPAEPSAKMFLVVITVGLVAGYVFRLIRLRMISKIDRFEKAAVSVYGLVITFMLLSASLNLVNPNWSQGAAILATVGASLFFSSDSLLAFNRYVKKIPRGQLIVRVLYHLGQFGLIYGVLLWFLKI